MLWLLCKVLFNDTATEGVLYYLSHCSSLQFHHCISTLLFYIYKQRAIPEKFLFQLQNSTDPNCVITSPCWGKSRSCSCRGSLPAALPRSLQPVPPQDTQPAGQEGAVVPSCSKIRITGVTAGLRPLFGICRSPRGKRILVPWGHGWSLPLRGHIGKLDPLSWHYRSSSEATRVSSHSTAAPARSYPKQFADP